MSNSFIFILYRTTGTGTFLLRDTPDTVFAGYLDLDDVACRIYLTVRTKLYFDDVCHIA